MRAYVDKETCIGCELCPEICPEIFFMEDDGLAEAKEIELPDELLDSAKEAEDSCPSDSIIIK